jgi:hypothetical protein
MGGIWPSAVVQCWSAAGRHMSAGFVGHLPGSKERL